MIEVESTKIKRSLRERGFVRVEGGATRDLPQGVSLWLGQVGWKDLPKSMGYIAVYLEEIGEDLLYGYLPYYFWTTPRKKVIKFFEREAKRVYDEIYSKKSKTVDFRWNESSFWEDIKIESDWGQIDGSSPQI